MKRFVKYAIFVLLILAVLWPSTAYAKEPIKGLFDDKVIFGGTYTLESGQSLDGNLVIFGGAVTTEADSTVNGDVVLIGGVAEVSGTVNGNMVGMGGVVTLTDTAVVNGDLVTFGAAFNRADGARVTGQVVDGNAVPFEFEIPPGIDVPPTPPTVPNIVTGVFTDVFRFFTGIVQFFFVGLMLMLMALLIVLFFADPVDRIANAAVTQPLITGAAGFLTTFLAPLALIALTITLILSPLAIVAFLILVVAWLVGWVALGLEIGRRIIGLFNAEWAPAITAALGTFILFLVFGSMSAIIPCVGAIPGFFIGMWGLGAVIMTRFGSQNYPVDEPMAQAEVALPEEAVTEAEGSDVTVVAPVADNEAPADEPLSEDV